ncbi:GLPGLI family protein [Rhodocytophaga rosea]|uniref:GLPGLI family protein n=1 Tax=Rhodocytophaga rosea TaxID=2704465 RepID=A0A6C0GD74_9BACT|nr:GLPGLI family protein [Rhodocytophaga rosea]QHT65857.1 GLPGLI family protein [Rhodocytophaga rosea]
MKIAYVFTLLFCLLATMSSSYAQSAASGTIFYEGARKIDPSQMKIVINGEEVKPGSADAPDVPTIASFSQTLIFSGKYAKEEREMPRPVIRTLDGGPGGPEREQTMKMEPPLAEKLYLDLQTQKIIRVMEVKKEKKIYQAEEIFTRASGWQDSDKTRKIAGYACRKATCPWKGETYTIWYTTDLDFTYSPIRELTPSKGVVLLVEGSEESFKAIKIDAKPVALTEVQPAAGAEMVSAEELNDKRDKAMADFRQVMMPGGPR